MESDSAKSAKFSIVRKLCQPGVYVLVCVVASLYVIVVIVFMTCSFQFQVKNKTLQVHCRCRIAQLFRTHTVVSTGDAAVLLEY